MAADNEKTKNPKRALRITFGVLLVVFTVAAVLVCGVMTNWFQTDFATYYISVNNQKITGGTVELEMPIDKELRFDIKNTLGKDCEYSVQIVPNVTSDTDFDFSVNGDLYRFSALKDLSDGFIIDKKIGYFTLRMLDYNIERILQKVFPGSEIQMLGGVIADKLYSVIITLDNGFSARINLITGTPLESNIYLDRTEIVF